MDPAPPAGAAFGAGAAAGAAHRVPAAVQLADCDGEGYVAGLEHHRDGNVYGDAAHCGAHL